MTFEKLDYRPINRPYHGLRVRKTGLYLTKSVDRLLFHSGIRYVEVLVDVQLGAIQLRNSSQMKGYKIEMSYVPAHVSSKMPQGRYLLEDEADGKFIFIRSKD